MRIQFKTEGGVAYFPGLSKPFLLDSETLPQAQAAELEQWVAAAHFFDLPPVVGTPPRGAADYRQYTVTIDREGQRHTVRLTDPIQDPNLQALVRYLETKARGGGTG